MICEITSGDDFSCLRHNPGMARRERNPDHIDAGKRLRQAREALGFTSIRAFADATGTDEDNLSNWERGVSLVPPWYIQRLKVNHGITFDWIYGGDAASLRHDLAIKILSPDPRTQSRPRRRGRPTSS